MDYEETLFLIYIAIPAAVFWSDVIMRLGAVLRLATFWILKGFLWLVGNPE